MPSSDCKTLMVSALERWGFRTRRPMGSFSIFGIIFIATKTGPSSFMICSMLLVNSSRLSKEKVFLYQASLAMPA